MYIIPTSSVVTMVLCVPPLLSLDASSSPLWPSTALKRSSVIDGVFVEGDSVGLVSGSNADGDVGGRDGSALGVAVRLLDEGSNDGALVVGIAVVGRIVVGVVGVVGLEVGITVPGGRPSDGFGTVGATVGVLEIEDGQDPAHCTLEADKGYSSNEVQLSEDPQISLQLPVPQ